MISAAILDCSLPREFEKKLKVRSITKSEIILEAESLCQAHGSIIARIVRVDELLVTEKDSCMHKAMF